MPNELAELLTYSRSQSFKKCRKRHWWEYEIGLRKEVDAKALRMGTAGHVGLDALKATDDTEQAVAAACQAYAVCPEGADQYGWNIECETIANLIRGYAWRWEGAPWKVLTSEESFRLPLRNPATNARSTIFDLAGKTDGVIRLEDCRLAVLEHKFLSNDIGPDSDFWRRLQLDTQASIYVWAARQLGYDISTVIYDVIRKPAIRPEQVALLDTNGFKIVLDAFGKRVFSHQNKPRQTGDTAKDYALQSRLQTPDEWGAKLLQDIGRRPDWYFARHEIARLDSDIEETLAELWDLQKTIREAQRTGRWYKSVYQDSCVFCAYFGLCCCHYDPQPNIVPEGFRYVEDKHPELSGD